MYYGGFENSQWKKPLDGTPYDPATLFFPFTNPNDFPDSLTPEKILILYESSKKLVF